jgi:predicted CoA-binding protein
MNDSEIKDILTSVKTIAMVGASDKPDRPSHGVMAFLLGKGLEVVPVNPRLAGQKILGRTVHADLSSIEDKIDMVDIFRRSDQVAPIVDDAIAIGAKVVWMQLGVSDEASATRARAAGLKVVMNHCPKIEWGRLGLG